MKTLLTLILAVAVVGPPSPVPCRLVGPSSYQGECGKGGKATDPAPKSHKGLWIGMGIAAASGLVAGVASRSSTKAPGKTLYRGPSIPQGGY